MPAYTYYKVTNKSKTGEQIFKTDNDFSVFLGFLSEYLNPPQDPSKYKKTFSVGGRVFQGIPHLPKNYFGKLSLVTYSLQNDEFNLLLKEIVAGSITSFVKSLLTRYSIYYNKKYHHNGSVFKGPCKTIKIVNREDINSTIYELDNKSRHTPKGAYPDTSEVSKDQIQNVSKYLYLHQRVPELVIACLIFVLLVAIGVRQTFISKNIEGEVAGISTEKTDQKEINFRLPEGLKK